MTLVCSFHAGPGAGKSSLAAGTFAELKWRHINCELVTEYAKDLVWGRTTATLENQLYVFAKQAHRLERLRGQVDVIVTDSPLLLALVYAGENPMPPSLHVLVQDVYRSWQNLDIWVERTKPYHQPGRLQNEAQALELDIQIERMLGQHNPDYLTFRGEKESILHITNAVEATLNAV